MKQNLEHMGGILGVTDDGYPIVTSDFYCEWWTANDTSHASSGECLDCKYANFHGLSQSSIGKSICCNPRCRMSEFADIGITNELLFFGRNK